MFTLTLHNKLPDGMRGPSPRPGVGEMTAHTEPRGGTFAHKKRRLGFEKDGAIHCHHSQRLCPRQWLKPAPKLNQDSLFLVARYGLAPSRFLFLLPLPRDQRVTPLDHPRNPFFVDATEVLILAFCALAWRPRQLEINEMKKKKTGEFQMGPPSK